jgi:Trypsin-co-occurring domain 1
MTSQVVTYAVDNSTYVSFEIELTPGFRPAGGTKEVLGRVQEAVAPAIEAAKTVLDKVKEVSPDQVELRFGVKVSGGANWFVAKTAGEGNFEITLAWDRRAASGEPGSRTLSVR